MDKYEFTGESKQFETLDGRIVTLYQIRALKTFKNHRNIIIRQGDLGGWVGNKDILSQNGTCWIDKNAVAFGYATIRDNSYVGGRTVIKDNAHIHGKCKIIGDANIGDFVEVTDRAVLKGNIKLTDFIKISGHTRLNGASLGGDIEVHNNRIKD